MTRNHNIDCPNCTHSPVDVHSANLARVGPFSKDTKIECPDCGHIWGYTNAGAGEREEKVWRQGADFNKTPIEIDRELGVVEP